VIPAIIKFVVAGDFPSQAMIILDFARTLLSDKHVFRCHNYLSGKEW
jgi:hypothetical protein